MNRKDARATLKKMAKGKYHAINIKETIHESGKVEKRYGVYITGCSWHTAESWKKAFDMLREEMIE